MADVGTAEAPATSPSGAGRATPHTAVDGGSGRPRARTVTAARAGLLALLFGFALEATCRIEDRVRYGTPLLSRATSHADLMVVDSDGAHGRPGVHFGKWSMNALGMRGPDVAVAKAPRTMRVVTVGASETFGLYESAGREYPRQLEDTLRRRLAAGACGSTDRVEVLNAALAGMSLPTIAHDVRVRLRRLAPDVVVIYPTPAGYLDNSPPRGRAVAGGPAEPLPWSAALRPRAVTRLRDQVKLAVPEALATWIRRREAADARRSIPADSLFETLPRERLALFEAALRRVIGETRAIGAEPVVATHANSFLGRRSRDAATLASWEKFYPRARGDIILAFEDAARDVTARVARDSAVAIADVAARLATADDAFADFVHFTDVGAAHAAGELASPTLAAAGAACGGPRRRSDR